MKNHAVKMELMKCIINTDNPSVLDEAMRVFQNDHKDLQKIHSKEEEEHHQHQHAGELAPVENYGYDEFL